MDRSKGKEGQRKRGVEGIRRDRRGRGVMIKSCFFFQAEDGIRDYKVTGVQTCALPILTTQPCLGSRVLKTSSSLLRKFTITNLQLLSGMLKSNKKVYVCAQMYTYS